MIFWLVLSATISRTSSRTQSKGELPDYPFKLGEKLAYSMSYGWFEIGEAHVEIDNEWWEIDGRPHFYIQCKVRTTGVFSFFSRLDVCMDSWVDVQALRPTESSRNVAFGRSIDVRTDRFDYADSVRISTYVEDVDSKRFHVFVRNDTSLLDALSTYLYLRSQVLQSDPVGKTYSVRTFFSNDLYEFGMRYTKNQDFSLKDKKWSARRFDLLFPETEEFPSDKRAYVIATDDRLRIPLKFLIEMKYGDFSFELVD